MSAGRNVKQEYGFSCPNFGLSYEHPTHTDTQKHTKLCDQGSRSRMEVDVVVCLPALWRLRGPHLQTTQTGSSLFLCVTTSACSSSSAPSAPSYSCMEEASTLSILFSSWLFGQEAETNTEHSALPCSFTVCAFSELIANMLKHK